VATPPSAEGGEDIPFFDQSVVDRDRRPAAFRGAGPSLSLSKGSPEILFLMAAITSIGFVFTRHSFLLF